MPALDSPVSGEEGALSSCPAACVAQAEPVLIVQCPCARTWWLSPSCATARDLRLQSGSDRLHRELRHHPAHVHGLPHLLPPQVREEG